MTETVLSQTAPVAPDALATTPAPLPGLTVTGTVAVVVARGGQVPPGGAEAVAEAGGQVLVVGSGAAEAAVTLHRATGGGPAAKVWWADTGPGLRAGALACSLAPLLAAADLVVLPASADGRDLAPRLAAALDVPLLAGAVQAGLAGDGQVRAELARVDGRLLVTATCAAPAVATLLPGARSVYDGPAEPVEAGAPAAAEPTARAATSPGQIPQQASAGALVPVEVALPAAPGGIVDVEVVEVLEPDPATMDLGEARRVLGGGAGLVARDGGLAGVGPAAAFELLAGVAAALGASAGATRVVTDAGWMGYDRQIGTTGVTLDPELYIAFGVSGASQHTGGLGAPRHVVSVNTDPSCPMTAMADLGLVTDAGDLLVELARRLGVPGPTGSAGPAGPPASPASLAADVPNPRAEITHG
ncbi:MULTISPECIES: mycofactocin-associated electron transfer flavoprotein alpha subunit [unclassified Pseudofrankia]|uniref:mycofactocin-associated electron transfer flavoprotein alpha subunit n=1 Tax=unclassified Pseudofrankia TaxID=2994372 RepID=UPI0008D8E05B|nr:MULTISPECIES: mycofactocin-associated electron transfer flavoprotein alpha subunit [unclassified Pseudofrankia]MDT3442351.1 mycofactocin-associated electron transfer flavoprotein alpha subunit [Pseudofrankia sp. BMG5.37]OHV47961.1 electron transfer flavoprotein subunit alpha [Pseudofrankia sp. BMG5.36]